MASYNHNHNGGIMDNSMQNGLQINLKDAIEDVGGFVPESACLWQYPEIIRKNLSAKAVNIITFLLSSLIGFWIL